MQAAEAYPAMRPVIDPWIGLKAKARVVRTASPMSADPAARDAGIAVVDRSAGKDPAAAVFAVEQRIACAVGNPSERGLGVVVQQAGVGRERLEMPAFTG